MAQQVDIRQINRLRAGPPTQVLVLGTMHVARMPDSFKIEFLEPLIDRLQSWRPDIITIEALSGLDCDSLFRHAEAIPGMAQHYCWDPAAAARATGLTVPAAVIEAERQLATWSAEPGAAQRRKLAATLLAANDRWSALVQWRQLPEAERRTGDGLDEALVAVLGDLLRSRNENSSIAAVLAARLGHERIHPTDDHSHDGNDFILRNEKDFATWLAALGSTLNIARLTKVRIARQEGIRSGLAALAHYRELNSSREMKDDIGLQFGRALADRSPRQYGRRVTAWWEVRNLRMVANVRATFGNRPGARVLSIVGVTHKPYFDAYLSLMHDVQVVDAQSVLR